MLHRNLIVFIAVLVIVTFTNSLFASGSRGSTGSGGGIFSSGSSRSLEDITYEHGKSLFKGRDHRYGKVKYCLATDDGAGRTKVKGSSLKPFKGGSSKDLAESIYNCDNPDQQIGSVFTSTDMTALVYYLNKRHKLGLN